MVRVSPWHWVPMLDILGAANLSLRVHTSTIVWRSRMRYLIWDIVEFSAWNYILVRIPRSTKARFIDGIQLLPNYWWVSTLKITIIFIFCNVFKRFTSLWSADRSWVLNWFGSERMIRLLVTECAFDSVPKRIRVINMLLIHLNKNVVQLWRLAEFPIRPFHGC